MHSAKTTLLKLCIILLGCGINSSAQVIPRIKQLNQDAVEAMRGGKWEDSHKLLVTATDNFGKGAFQNFGPRFGWFWYHRGYCEIKLKMFDEAMRSFEICYVKFANNLPRQNQAPSFNFYNKKALLMWGHAAKGAEKWSASVRLYKRFLEERDPARDHYEQGVFHINMAINHYKLGKITEGNHHFETAIKEKTSFPTLNKGIMAAFNALVAAVIKKKDEAALLDFLGKNRAHLKLEPFEAHEFSPLFMKLAQDAQRAEMTRLAFELYSLVPSTVTVIDGLKSRLSILGHYEKTIRDGSMTVKKANLVEDLTKLEKANTSGKVYEIFAYLNTAVLHEEDGNIRGAFAVYEQMELYFPNAKIMIDGKVSPGRENNLYNLVRTASLIDEALSTEHYGSIFLKNFPESKYIKEVRRLMMESLFYCEEYQTCIKVAEQLLPKLAEPSEQHCRCLFVLGGSKHYLGRYNDAQPLLNRCLDTYKKQKSDKHHIQAVSYYQAANYSRLREWTKSASLLDQFLKDYPDPKTNIYYPFALFDRATCHYAKNEGRAALARVNQILKDFPNSPFIEQTLTLKGNILESFQKPKKAELCYIEALTIAEKKNNDVVAGESLSYLIALLGKEPLNGKPNPRLAEVIPYYNHFWKHYGHDSPFHAKVAVAGIPAMRKAGKINEALERLQSVIANIGKQPGTPGLEEAIGSYTDEYLRNHTIKELSEHYYSRPGHSTRDRVTPALLRYAIICAYEQALAGNDPSVEAKDAKAIIRVLYKELKSDFALQDLTNLILVKVGDFIREETPHPQSAQIYYEEALRRSSDQSHKFAALLGLAQIKAKGGQGQKTEAIELLKRVLADSDDPDEKEKALNFTISIQREEGN